MPNSEIRQIEKADLKYVCQSWLYDYQESPEMAMPGLILSLIHISEPTRPY